MPARTARDPRGGRRRRRLPLLGRRRLRHRRARARRRRPRHGTLSADRRRRRPISDQRPKPRRSTSMERDEALAALREVAVEVLSVEPDAVTEDARFKEDLDADSLDLVELVMGLEERFDISVPEEDLEGVATVGQAVDLVLAKVACQGMSDARVATIAARAAGRASHRHGRQDARPGPTSSRSGSTLARGRVRWRGRSSCSTRRRRARCGSRARCATSTRSTYFGPKEVRRQDRVTHLGFAAAADALERRRRARAADPERCAVIAATGDRRAHHARGELRDVLREGRRRASARSSCR